MPKTPVGFFVVLTVLLIPIVIAVTALEPVFPGADWLSAAAWVAAGLIAVNPGLLPLVFPLYRGLNRAKGGYIVREAVPAEGVGIDTLNRSAAVAEANAAHPIGACLRAYCGDVGCPPEKFVEMPGLGASAQFSGQMIHIGSAEYMRGLGVEVPDISGTAAHVALDGRALGYYRFYNKEGISKLRAALLTALGVSCACKLFILTALAVGGTSLLPALAAAELVSFGVSLFLSRQATKT